MNSAVLLADETYASEWSASLQLSFDCYQQQTRLLKSLHKGPLRVQRPFFPEGRDLCHIYLLHPPGGMVGGDDLQMQFQLQQGTNVLLTTPAAGKVYRTTDQQKPQRQSVHLTVEDGASLEWLPQENIVFNAARAELETRIDLQGNSQVLAWEIVCLGRPAGNYLFESGSLRQRLSLYRDNQPLYLENSLFIGGSSLQKGMWGLQNQPVTGTLFCTCKDTEQALALAESLRAELNIADSALLGVTAIEGLLLVRYLGPCTEQARELFIRAWQFLRPQILQRPACRPRIWNT